MSNFENQNLGLHVDLQPSPSSIGKRVLSFARAPFFYSIIPLDARIDVEAFELSDESDWNADVVLFKVPEHLRKKWWNGAAQEFLAANGLKPKFAVFQKAFADFASYKLVPLTPKDKLSVMARAPGESAVASDERVICFANLGDEATSILANGESIRLEVGDACWASSDVELSAGSTQSKSDLDVLLKITRS